MRLGVARVDGCCCRVSRKVGRSVEGEVFFLVFFAYRGWGGVLRSGAVSFLRRLICKLIISVREARVRVVFELRCI